MITFDCILDDLEKRIAALEKQTAKLKRAKMELIAKLSHHEVVAQAIYDSLIEKERRPGP